MPTKRFDKLDPEKSARILRVAAEEFAANGFETASYNRIIAASGVSKGAMYYYFEDKADLYETVFRRLTADMLADLGRFEPCSDPDAFWSQVSVRFAEAYAAAMDDPVVLGLMTSLAREATGPSAGLLEDLRRECGEWLQHLLEVGQDAGAIRTDLPDSLLIKLSISVGEAHDLWFAEHHHELAPGDLANVLPQAVDLYRRLLAPA